jgi:hypothetical protein
VIGDTSRHRDVLRKCTHAAKGRCGYSYDFSVVAEVDLATTTKKTFTAEDSRVECDAIADLKAGDSAPDGLDNASRFMTHDDGRETTARTSVIAMHIAAADTAGMDANQQFVWIGLRLWHINDVELLVVRQEESFHKSPSLTALL